MSSLGRAMRPVANRALFQPAPRTFSSMPVFNQSKNLTSTLARRGLLQQSRGMAKEEFNKLPIVHWTKNQFRLAGVFGLGAVGALIQHYYGHTKEGENFFDYRFVAEKKWTEDEDFCDNLADFYGSEDFMQVYVIFPFIEKMMMRGSSFDDAGVCHAWGLLGKSMEVSMEFEDGDSIEGDDTVVGFFNKRERFHDVATIPIINKQFTLWDQLVDFGYHKRRDGSVLVYHTGVKFYGPWPIRMLFHMHAKYVIKATRKYVNSEVFGDSERLEEGEKMRHEIPLYAINDFMHTIQGDLESVVAEKLKQGDKEAHQAAEKALREIKKVRHTIDLAKTKKTLTMKKVGNQDVSVEKASINLGHNDVNAAVADATKVIANHGHDAGVTNQALQHLTQEASGQVREAQEDAAKVNEFGVPLAAIAANKKGLVMQGAGQKERENQANSRMDQRSKWG